SARQGPAVADLVPGAGAWRGAPALHGAAGIGRKRLTTKGRRKRRASRAKNYPQITQINADAIWARHCQSSVAWRLCVLAVHPSFSVPPTLPSPSRGEGSIL